MGSRIARFEFQAGENEQIETVIRIPEEPKSIIHGVVIDSCDRVIENAVVKLFEVENPCNPCSLKSVSHTFTDESGQFLFGPLTSGMHYVIKVWVSDVKVRNLIIHPEDRSSTCRCEEKVVKEDENIAAEKQYSTGEVKVDTQIKPKNIQQRKARVIVKNQRQP